MTNQGNYPVPGYCCGQPVTAAGSPGIPPKKKSSKKGLVIGITAAACILILVICALLIMKLVFPGSSGSEPYIITAMMQEDGTAYIPLCNGKVIKINEDVQMAQLTADRKHIAVLLEDGSLYVTDPKLSKKHTVGEKVLKFTIRNGGLVYQDKADTLYRVSFRDCTAVKIGTGSDYILAPDSLSVLFASQASSICSMAYNGSEPVKLGTYKHSAALQSISNDGKTAVWTDGGNSQVIYFSENNELTELGTVPSEYDYTSVIKTRDQMMLAITNTAYNRMWLKSPNRKPLEIKLPDNLASSLLFTSDGYFSDSNIEDVESLYIATEGSRGSDIYHIALNGDQERVLSHVDSFHITDGCIIYTDAQQNLMYGKLDGNNLKYEEKIAGDVDYMIPADGNQYIYFTKDLEDDTANLYCYKLGSNEPKKVSSDISCWGIDWGFAWPYLSFSADGDTVYFFQDVEEIGDTYVDCGTLFKWSYGSESTQKISGDVLTFTPYSGRLHGVIEEQFMFEKYSSHDDHENIFVNWIYFDGSDTEKMASDVIH